MKTGMLMGMLIGMVFISCAAVSSSTIESQALNCADPIIQAELASGAPQAVVEAALSKGTVNATPMLETALKEVGPVIQCVTLAGETDANTVISNALSDGGGSGSFGKALSALDRRAKLHEFNVKHPVVAVVK